MLAVFGIAVVGMLLLFLTKLAAPFWIAAFLMLLLTIWFYVKKGCISQKLIIFNSGLIIIGFPFRPAQTPSVFFWIIGGILVIISATYFIRERVKK